MKTHLATLLLRLTFAATMLISHGVPKLMDFSYLMNRFPDPLGLGHSLSLGMAIFSEVLCAFLVVIGLHTRLATIPLIITMAVAVLVVHGGDTWDKMELAFIYGLGFVMIALIGPGKFSLDYFWRRKQ